MTLLPFPGACVNGERLAVACAALAVALGGAAIVFWPDLRERWASVEDMRAPAGADGAPAEARSETVRLAFLAADGQTLEEETRDVMLRRSVVAAARAIIEELVAGSRQGRGAVLPAGTRVRQVFVDKRGVAYVDLSGEVFAAAAAADPWTPAVRAALAVAASLGMSLPEIAQVQILVDGHEVPVVAGEMDLRHPLPAALPMRPASPMPQQQ